jgi:hypothetical protein
MRIRLGRRRHRAFVAAVASLMAAGALAGCTAPVDDAPVATASVTEPAEVSPTSAAAPLVVPEDGGPRSQAQGTVSGEVGRMTCYVPAAGDTTTGIAGRFGVCIADLGAANSGYEVLEGVEILVARTTATPLDDRACLG